MRLVDITPEPVRYATGANAAPVTAVDVDALEAARAAMERWLRDRVQVPEHRAITASYAYVELPEVAPLLAAVRERDALRAAVERVKRLVHEDRPDPQASPRDIRRLLAAVDGGGC